MAGRTGKNSALWIFATFCVFCAPGFTFEAEEGEICPGAGGKCIKATDCPISNTALMSRKSHNLMRCGFSGFIELVCCPDSGKESPPTTASPTQVRGPNTAVRKSKQACDDLSNELPAQLSWQILGGVDAKPGEFPHMAALGYRGVENNDITFQCGGSLISNNYVLTAAHCVVRIDSIIPEVVRMGKIDLLGNTDKLSAQDYRIENITVHPGYQRRSKVNDIALLRLDKKVTTSEYVHAACLYNKNDDPIGLLVTGWGATEVNGNSASILQKAPLSPVNVSSCNTTFQQDANPRSISGSQICALSDDGTIDSCQGDSGGPLQVQLRESNIHSIVGITSFGRGCGGPTPGVYTRVFSYLDWIEGIVWK